MKESQIEEKIRQYAEGKNCLFKKFTSPGWCGVPDRILITPLGRTAFMEIKKPGGDVAPKQLRICVMLNARGVPSAIVDSVEGARVFIDALLDCPTQGLSSLVDVDTEDHSFYEECE